MKFFYSIIILFAINLTASGQNQVKAPLDKFSINFQLRDINLNVPSFLINNNVKSLLDKKASRVPSNFVYSRFGFFCKTECTMQNKTLIPVKFRLGTLEYVNHLEYNQ